MFDWTHRFVNRFWGGRRGLGKGRKGGREGDEWERKREAKEGKEEGLGGQG